MERLEPSTAVDVGRKTARQLEMDALVGYLLLGGVLLSMILIVIGLVWRWLSTGRVSLDYRISDMNLFQFVVTEVRLAASGEMRPRLLVNLGIAALMLTPYLRVVASMVYFLVGLKNWKYTLFTAFVLIVLTYSLFLRS